MDQDTQEDALAVVRLPRSKVLVTSLTQRQLDRFGVAGGSMEWARWDYVYNVPTKHFIKSIDHSINWDAQLELTD